MILDMFKPAWQSTSVSRRRKGVQKLNPHVTGEADALYSLASSDPEQSVRLAAIERISNITLLVRLLKNAPTSLEQDKLGRLVTQATLTESSDSEGLQKAIDLIDMDDDLLKISLEATSSDAQVQAASKVRGEEALLEIASKHPLSKLRVIAAEKIDHPTLLNQLLESAKGRDKSVWRIAKEKLDDAKTEEQAIEKQREEANNCFEQIQLMQNRDVDTLFKQKWILILSKWNDIPGSEKDHLDVSELLDSINTKVEAYEARSAEEAFQVESRADAQEEQIQTLSLLSEALEILKNTETDDIDIPSLRATLTTQTSRWQAAAEVHSPLAHQTTAFDRDSRKLSQAIDAIYTLRKHINEIKTIHEELHELAPDDLAKNGELHKKTSSLIKRIQWPADVIIPKDMQRLNTDFQCLEDRQRRQAETLTQHQDKLAQLINGLESTITDGQLSDTEASIKKIQSAIKKLPAHHSEAFRNQLKPLIAQYAELKDWQAFAAQPKKEALIQSMEGLAQDTTEDVDPGVRLDYIQKLQAEWKELGRLTPAVENDLWEKFQAASKAAYAPCKAHYEEQANTRERNKVHREKMCNQLQDYINNYNWAKADWQSVQDTLKLAREEWKRHLPVDRKFHKALEEQFQDLIHQLNERLNTHKQSNQRIKQRLLEQALTLKDKEDVDSAIVEMRKLRDEWRRIGMLPPEHYKAMNQAFYDAYNMLTERKQKQWSDVSAQKKHNAEQIKSVLNRLDEILARNESKTILGSQQELQHAEQAFTEFMPLLEQDQKTLRKRFETIAAQYSKTLKSAKHQQKAQTLATLWHRSEILRKLESQVLQNTLENSDLQDITEEWNQIPETNHQSIATLNARFDAAIHARSTQDITSLHNITSKADVYGRELCTLMEIISEIPSPAEDHDLRMQLQVNRLNQSLQTRKDQREEQWSEHENLMLEWCNTGPLSPEAYTQLNSRFQKGKKKVADGS